MHDGKSRCGIGAALQSVHCRQAGNALYLGGPLKADREWATMLRLLFPCEKFMHNVG
jgi:hypothetical protein